MEKTVETEVEDTTPVGTNKTDLAVSDNRLPRSSEPQHDAQASNSDAKDEPEPGYLLDQLEKGKKARFLIDSHAAKAVSDHLANVVAFDSKAASWALWNYNHWKRHSDVVAAKRAIAEHVEIGRSLSIVPTIKQGEPNLPKK